jgi:cold shock CspA family protein
MELVEVVLHFGFINPTKKHQNDVQVGSTKVRGLHDQSVATCVIFSWPGGIRWTSQKLKPGQHVFVQFANITC